MKAENNTAVYGTEEETITPERAFITSDGHSLNGIKLEPYTVERMWAADAMGLRYGNLSKAAVRQWVKTGVYPGMAGDVGIVIWLCSLTDTEEVRSARRDPSSAEELAADFVMTNGIASPKQKKFWEAYKVFRVIMDEVNASVGEPENKKKETKTSAK